MERSPSKLAQVEQELGYIEHEEDAHDQHHPEKAGRIPQLLKLHSGPQDCHKHQQRNAPVPIKEEGIPFTSGRKQMLNPAPGVQIHTHHKEGKYGNDQDGSHVLTFWRKIRNINGVSVHLRT
jgi:hypothetical protein